MNKKIKDLCIELNKKEEKNDGRKNLGNCREKRRRKERVRFS